MTVAILDYDAGNIESVRLALRHVGGDPVFVRDADEANTAERIVFPGVGSAGQCMDNFRSRGFDQVVRQAVAAGKPVLAICIGMQLLFDFSEEDGGTQGLALLPGTVRLFHPKDPTQKVPHMGWNQVVKPQPHPVLGPGNSSDDYYFVHSYYAHPDFGDGLSTEIRADQPVVYGWTEYGGVRFASMVGMGSLLAAQFHPEKSGRAGLAILDRFLAWDGQLC